MTKPPQILSRKTVARSRLFEIEQVRLRFSNGAEADFERLVGSGGAVMVIPLDGEELLLAKEYALGVEGYELGFVKGRVDAGETPETSAARELQEEIGYAPGKLEMLTTVSQTPAYTNFRSTVFLATDLQISPLPGDEPEPIEVVRWPVPALDDLLQRPDFSDARCKLAVYLLRDFLQK